MQQTKPTTYLLDFDSTFIKSEGLDELARVSLEGHPDKDQILSEIQKLTKLGMNGEIPFDESLQRRVALLKSNKKQIKKLGSILSKQISSSIESNRHFFETHKENIYIISGGFKEIIFPVIKKFGIKQNHVFANTFLYDEEGTVIGVDTTNPMSQNQGKVKVVKSLQLHNDLYIIGDGYTDYELRKLGLVKKFIAFTENIQRETVIEQADEIAPTFDEFLYVNDLPRTLSYPKSRISVHIIGEISNTDKALLKNEKYKMHTAKHPIDKHISIIITSDPHAISETMINDSHKLLAIGIIPKKQFYLSKMAAQKGIAVFNGESAVKRIINYINTGNTNLSLSLPNLQLPQHGNVHRLLHIHHNVSGILAKINSILAEHDINILGQYLKTTKDIGYVIIDVDKAYDKSVLKVLKRIPDTIRFRILY